MFFKKAWKKNEEAAVALMEAAPEKALELLDLALAEAPGDGPGAPRTTLLEEHAHVNDLLGRSAAAADDRARVVAALTPALAKIDAGIPHHQGEALLRDLRDREDLLVRLGRSADEVEAARMRLMEQLDAAITRTRNHLFLPPLLERKAEVLERMGRQEDGARVRLLTADVLLAYGGDEDARARLTALTAPVFVSIYGLRGLEFKEAFGRAYAGNLRIRAEQIRQTLVDEGRAIALGGCRKCGALIEVTHTDHAPNIYEQLKLRCPAGHKVTDFRFVVPADAPAARREVAAGAVC